jgi:hypothetical protein
MGLTRLGEWSDARTGEHGEHQKNAVTPHAHSRVRRTLRISCEAVPPSIGPAGAQGGTSACHTGAALSFVSCIRLFCGTALPTRSLRGLGLSQGRPWACYPPPRPRRDAECERVHDDEWQKRPPE